MTTDRVRVRYFGRGADYGQVTAISRWVYDPGPGFAEEAWNVDKHAWVPGNAVQTALGMGGTGYDDITEEQARQFAPEAFA
jgi:hypothetical protein